MKKSKRILREKVLQQTGITGNSKEEKVRIAESIIDDSEYKQDLCNSYQGLDFSFIEKIMEEVLKNNRPRNAPADKPLEPPPEKAVAAPKFKNRIKKEAEPDVAIGPESFYTKEESSSLIYAGKK